MHLSSASPRGVPRADVGEYGDYMRTLQQISALVVGEMWGLRFLNALLSGRMRGLCFCSTERRLETIDCSLDRCRMVEEKRKKSFKIHCFLSIKQTIKKIVKNLYVFVGISNFKIPLQVYILLFIRAHVRAPSDL